METTIENKIKKEDYFTTVFHYKDGTTASINRLTAESMKEYIEMAIQFPKYLKHVTLHIKRETEEVIL